MRKNDREFSLIVAFNHNMVIGVDGYLPWRLSADLQNFKRLTLNHSVIMGRKTFESIGKPLPERQNIVVSNTLKKSIPNITVTRSVEEAMSISKSKKSFFIGGSKIYQTALCFVDSIYLTLVNSSSIGDAFFPRFDMEDWTVLFETRYRADTHNEYDFIIKKLVRKIMKS
tara:strand:- start:101 stop:610 length:510 start_codon:yes stop_codon:yes gene_type:complete